MNINKFIQPWLLQRLKNAKNLSVIVNLVGNYLHDGPKNATDPANLITA